MQDKKKASAPSYHTPGARKSRIENDAATIIPFERKRRPTANELLNASRFKMGLAVGSMRNDERYKPKPQSDQLEIFGLGMAGEQDVVEAKKWIDANPDAWWFMIENARRLKMKGYVSINYLVNMVRNELHVGCKNGIAPALARIMEARYPDLRGAFNKHRSQSDGFSE